MELGDDTDGEGGKVHILEEINTQPRKEEQNMAKENIKIGDRVKDVVTGLEGVAVSRIEYINGCIQFGVCGKVNKEGKVPDVNYIDHKQLKVIGKPVELEQADTGGPQQFAPRN